MCVCKPIVDLGDGGRMAAFKPKTVPNWDEKKYNNRI
jgi:hypothetical protein